MATVTITPERLGLLIQQSVRKNREQLREAMRRGARRAVQWLASNNGPTPVFDGRLKNAWDIEGSGDEIEIVNSAPYAGIVERGSRPHPVSSEGVAAIREWVRRTLFLEPGKGGALQPISPKTADGELAYAVDEVTWAIVNKLRREGSRGHFFIKNSIPRIQAIIAEEVRKALTPGV